MRIERHRRRTRFLLALNVRQPWKLEESPMNVSEAINTRRAIKWYDADHEIPEQTFRELMEHAILSPTAFNIQNWRFLRVRDSEQRKAIRAVAWDQAQVTDASELLVLCFDTKAWSRNRRATGATRQKR